MYDGLTTVIVTIVTAIVLTFLSPFISPYVVKLRYKLKRKLSLKDVYKACYEIFEDMSQSEFTPAYILGIDGGGCIVAAYLGRLCNSSYSNKAVTIIEFAADRSNPKEPEFPKDKKFFDMLKQIIVNEKVLLVDDLSNSSKTLTKAKNLLEEVAGEVRIAVISKPSRKQADRRDVDLRLYNFFRELAR